jgi:hypothetical protein
MSPNGSVQMKTRFAYPASGEKPRTVGLETNETPPSAPTTPRPTLAKLLADALKRRYPDGRPAVKNREILVEIAKGPEGVSARMRTLNRALNILGWPLR